MMNDINAESIRTMTKYFLRSAAGYIRDNEVDLLLRPFLVELTDLVKIQSPGASIAKDLVKDATMEFLLKELDAIRYKTFIKDIIKKFNELTNMPNDDIHFLFLTCTNEASKRLIKK